MSGARAAAREDEAAVVASLAREGIVVDPRSVRRRLEADDGGVILGLDALCCWALDAGALRLYDFAGDASGLGALLAAAGALALARAAAVTVVTLDAGSRWHEPLRGAGFEPDEAELSVRDGTVRTEVTLVRLTADRTP